MNGIYHADFSSLLGTGSGTVFLEDGKIHGGDATMAYFGSYTSKEDTLKGNVNLLIHGTGYSIFGDAKSLNFEGQRSGNLIQGKATIPGTTMQGTISLKKVGVL